MSPRSRNFYAFNHNIRRRIRKRSLSIQKSREIDRHNGSGKYWSKFFSNPRASRDSAAYEWALEHVEDIAILPLPELVLKILEGSEGEYAVWEEKVLNKFFMRNRDRETETPEIDAWAWVCDLKIGAGRSRDYERSFNADGLYEVLKESRFDHHTLEDVDQRMIYISKLTPEFVGSLTKTVWTAEVEVLRDAVCKHIAMETSLRVHVPIMGFPTYRLEFHIAHLLLRKSPEIVGLAGGHEEDGKTGSLLDLAFLELGDSDGKVAPHSIYQGHMSVVICGWSNLQWTGYAFTKADNDGLDEEDQEDLKGHFLTSLYGFDFGLPRGSANCWDARRYWLRLVAHRCQYVLREWLYLVRTIEEGVELWKEEDPCSSNTGKPDLQADEIQRSLNKTLQIMQLLRRLRDELSTTLRVYNRFDKPGGDRCYFSDITDCSSVQNSIVESFEKLTDLSLRLRSLDDSCKRFATHLGRILDLESNRLSAQSNKLSQEANEHQQASHRLSERMHKMNEETSILNKEMRKLNERSTEAACMSQTEAMKTSRSTRVNVELLLLTTPFGIVLQYFGSEQEIFSFNRNPKTFVLATIVLMLVLRLLTLSLEYGGVLFKLIYRKRSNRSTTSSPSGGSQDIVELDTMQHA
ncbi:unnamed protein product [Alternaria alternata]